MHEVHFFPRLSFSSRFQASAARGTAFFALLSVVTFEIIEIVLWKFYAKHFLSSACIDFIVEN